MRVTDAVKVDAEFRHYRKAQTLAASITRRMDYYKRACPLDLKPTHALRAQAIRQALEREIKAKRLVWEINSSLSRRPILRLPTTETLNWIFDGLPQPRPAQLSDHETALTELMTMRGRQIAANQHKTALAYEIAYRAYNNYYMIFNTLTVAPGQYYAVFNRTSTAFKEYIRRFERLTITPNANSTTERHARPENTHFAVVEEGGKNGRLHIHVMHFLHTLPRGAYDPNTGRIQPTKRELDCVRNLWPYGRSAPIMVRYSPTDGYGLLGYRWPIDQKTNAPLRIRSPLALANYLSKYITKGYNSCQRSKLLWRVRKSQKLGRQIVDEITASLSTSTLLLLTTADNLRTKLNNNKIPQHLLRLSALRTLQNRLPSHNHNGYDTITAIAKLSTPRLSPLQSLRASTQTILQNNLQSTTHTSMTELLHEDTFKAAWQELQTAAKQADDKYFRKNAGVYGTASSQDTVYVRQITTTSETK